MNQRKFGALKNKYIFPEYYFVMIIIRGGFICLLFANDPFARLRLVHQMIIWIITIFEIHGSSFTQTE